MPATPFLSTFCKAPDTPKNIEFQDQYGNQSLLYSSDCRPGNVCNISMKGGSAPDFGSDLNLEVTVFPHDAAVGTTTVTLSPKDRTTCEKVGGKLGLSLEYHSSDPFHYSMQVLKFCLVDLFSSESLIRVKAKQEK
ncbi:hypothetical protein [Dyella choica]|uniref:Uncharacterized protein n=1 Tax=Dyella choica TaxID=1927959 RepID=A0A3S0WUQ8_9GAMM|nr:hypothetical protein [Dyella choica]RUL73676.1 hypothetical protein EKH80_15285 [Dyella choica]